MWISKCTSKFCMSCCHALHTKYLPVFFFFSLLTRFDVVLSKWRYSISLIICIRTRFHVVLSLQSLSYNFLSQMRWGKSSFISIQFNSPQYTRFHVVLSLLINLLDDFESSSSCVDFGEVGYPDISTISNRTSYPELILQWDFGSHKEFKLTLLLYVMWFVVTRQIQTKAIIPRFLVVFILSQCDGDLISPLSHALALYDF
jgi:hypothetical protein